MAGAGGLAGGIVGAIAGEAVPIVRGAGVGFGAAVGVAVAVAVGAMPVASGATPAAGGPLDAGATLALATELGAGATLALAAELDGGATLALAAADFALPEARGGAACTPPFALLPCSPSPLPPVLAAWRSTSNATIGASTHAAPITLYRSLRRFSSGVRSPRGDAVSGPGIASRTGTVGVFHISPRAKRSAVVRDGRY